MAPWSQRMRQLAGGATLLLALLCVGVAAEAANTTAPGEVKIATQDQSLMVTAAYGGDDNGNNTLLIEWDENGGDWGTLLGSASLPHALSPYAYTIAGLTNFTPYQVRVTYQDGDNVPVASAQTFTDLKPYSPLLHNSLTTGSLKWSAQNGWGVPGGRYGEFTCGTCHVKNSSNIKRVRATIDAPDTGVDFPGGNSAAVSFQDARNDSSDFGDDTGGHANSNRICEVCHSANKYHNFNTANNTGGLAHFNRKDCTQCHAHGNGFKAGACSSCHGGGSTGAGGKNFWPDASTTDTANDDPGRHLAHMSALAELVYGLADATALLNDAAADSKQVDLCGYCHDNPGGDADHSTTLPAETAFHPVWNKSAAAVGTYTAVSCANIACHNDKTTATALYGWFDGDASACIMCHNDVTSDAATTGETHNDHLNAAASFGRAIGCGDCHANGPSWAGNTTPSANHINGALDIGGSVALTYTGSIPTGTAFGSCGTNACHNAGTGTFTGAPVNSSYAWDDNGLDDCGICHAGVPATGSHAEHANTALTQYGSGGGYTSWTAFDTNAAATNVYDFGCGKCHGDTLGNHLNAARNLNATGWNGSTCSAAYCHSHKGLDGVATVQVITPAWGGSFPAGDRCAQCHENSPVSSGHEEHQVGFHYNAVYSGKKEFLPVKDSDPLPANLVTGPNGRDQLRGHGGLLDGDRTANSTTMTCYVCHNDTVTAKGNDLNPVCFVCHNGSDAPAMGTMTVANTNAHVNGQPDVVFVDEKIRSKAQVRDDLFDVPELSNNWTRKNTYKKNDGSSYDESPDTLRNLSASYGGWATTDTVRYAGQPEEMTQPARTCLVSCHLWEKGRVDKYPVHWDDNSIHGPQPIMCIDCHSRLPK